MKHTFLQFELWKDCNNKCAFCFNDNSRTSAEFKENRIDLVMKELANPEYNTIEKIGFIGGEFFDGQLETQSLRDKFTRLVNIPLTNQKIKQVLITTSLLLKNNKDLIYFLNNINNKQKLLLCTSWDTKYRFKTPEALHTWENNVEYIHKHYPQVKIHVEIIPTQWHIESVLSDKFNILDFEKKYDVTVDYTDLNSGFNYADKYAFQKAVPGFFPKRDDFLKFLQKVYTEKQATTFKFLNFAAMSTLLWMTVDKKYTLFNGLRGPIDGITINTEYGLPPMQEKTSDYIDSHVRMRKDVLDMWEVVYA